MAYWIVKGRPDNAGVDFVTLNKKDTWHSKNPTGRLKKKDRLFFWSTSPHLEVIGLGEVVGPINSKPRGEISSVRLKYITNRLKNSIKIDSLRRIKIFENSSILKPGASGTFFSITDDQGDILLELVKRANKGTKNIWSESLKEIPDVDDSEYHGIEGKRVWVEHLRTERDRKLVANKKLSVLESGKKLKCEVCGLIFEKLHPDKGLACCEVHHALPLSKYKGSKKTRLEDLHILCSNCHRMIHKFVPLPSVSKFKAYLRNKK